MACDSATLIALQATDGYDRLSARDVLLCLASAYGSAASLTATTALALAQTNGFGRLSDADLYETLAGVLGATNSQANSYGKLSDTDISESWLATQCT